MKKKPIDWDDVELFCIRKGLDFNLVTWRKYVLTVRAHDLDRAAEFEHTRAICYFVAWPYMGETKVRIEQWWPLPTDVVEVADEQMMGDYMKWITEQYAIGGEIYSFEDFLSRSRSNN